MRLYTTFGLLHGSCTRMVFRLKDGGAATDAPGCGPVSSPSSAVASGPPAVSSDWLRADSLSHAFRALSWFAQGSEAYQIDVSRAALRTCKPLLYVAVGRFCLEFLVSWEQGG